MTARTLLALAALALAPLASRAEGAEDAAPATPHHGGTHGKPTSRPKASGKTAKPSNSESRPGAPEKKQPTCKRWGPWKGKAGGDRSRT
jgi:hypothetical protein